MTRWKYNGLPYSILHRATIIIRRRVKYDSRTLASTVVSSATHELDLNRVKTQEEPPCHVKGRFVLSYCPPHTTWQLQRSVG